MVRNRRSQLPCEL